MSGFVMGLALSAAAVAGFSLVSCGLQSQSMSHRRLLGSVFVRTEDTSEQNADDRLGQKPSTIAARLTDGIVFFGDIERILVEFMAVLTLKDRLKSLWHLWPLNLKNTNSIEVLVRRAGLGSIVSIQGVEEARVRLAFFGIIAGALLGLTLSNELAIGLAVIGGLVGWNMPIRVLRSRVKRRADDLEHHLPEALEVISLGLRSGLTFDRSLELYDEHFDNPLAKSLGNALHQWSCGLVSRSSALRELAATYDSQLFSRVVENIIRSLRFGASLTQSLESTAVEARQNYQAKKQEAVAKAPVKMMLPTGTLILPAMLILVLGPVLLELVGTF